VHKVARETSGKRECAGNPSEYTWLSYTCLKAPPPEIAVVSRRDNIEQLPLVFGGIRNGKIVDVDVGMRGG
jgi:hypothetical protein